MFDTKPLLIFLAWAASVVALFFLFAFEKVGYNSLYIMFLLWSLGLVLGFSYPNIVWFSLVLVAIVTFLDWTTTYHESFAIVSDYLKTSCLKIFEEESITFNICSWFLGSGPVIFVSPFIGWIIKKLTGILPKFFGLISERIFGG